MPPSRPLASLLFLSCALVSSCGDDQRTRGEPADNGGSKEPLVPPGAGGAASGGAAWGGAASGGAPLGSGGAAGGTSGGASGGSPMTGGSGGSPPLLGGMGGEGGSISIPTEPTIVPCESIEQPPPPSECPLGPFVALPLLAEEEEIVLCTRSANVEWAEGPIWRAEDSTLLFSNFDEEDAVGHFNGDLMMYREGEGCSELFTEIGTNGLAWGPAGTLIAGRQSNRTLSRINMQTGEICSLADSFEGKRLSSPNDVAVRSDGNIYFSDPGWNLGDRAEELPQSLYRISPDGAISLVSAYDNLRPNGVSLSPDESRLYLAIQGSIVVFDVDAVGALSNPRDFVTGPSVDGMAVDCAGNVYASTGHVYSPAGELLGEFWGGTNLAFGGADRQTLYITGHRRLTSLRVAIPGLPY